MENICFPDCGDNLRDRDDVDTPLLKQVVSDPVLLHMLPRGPVSLMN